MKRFVLIVAALAVIALILWQAGRRSPAVAKSAGGPTPGATVAGIAQPKIQNAKPAAAPERSTLADALNAPSADIRADLQIVNELITTFRSNFPRDGNPVGNNADITAVLAGKNQLQLALIPPDHPAINRGGELCDRWGTPFFFHAESGTRMAIRSAGPDQKLFTEDDVVFAP